MTKEVDPSDKELVYLLGSMVRNAGSLEFMLRLLVGGLSGSAHGSLIAAGEGVSRLIDLSQALAKAQPDMTPGRLEALNGILSRCRAAFSRRDQYVHGLWTVSHGTQEWSTWRSRRNKPEPYRQPAQEHDLRELGETMSQLYVEISAWQWKPKREQILAMGPLVDEE
ncbi:hypothetical protein SGFS_048620 [Streptomyces graminofaciens]|uniref:Uncharacterized protein n=1 Tax=Streptomyces graminofaciens TaxID=68212 RepID=A0ABM8HKX1_9ACTN|nr:hypothetical protein [Streptomyces graminofaciens]BBC33568.1 hypothetical protein SGFS_048620 [Streptomyces graminofaciens]